jgi:hypothetical protein
MRRFFGDTVIPQDQKTLVRVYSQPSGCTANTRRLDIEGLKIVVLGGGIRYRIGDARSNQGS